MLVENSLERSGLNFDFKLVIHDSKIKAEGVKAANKYFKKNPQRGFRPGVLPKNFIKSKSHEFRSMVLTDLISKEIDNIYKEMAVNPYIKPDVDLTENKIGEDVVCSVKTILHPELNLEDYKNEHITRLKPILSEDFINKSKRRLLDNFATWNKIDSAIEFEKGISLVFNINDKEFKFRIRLEADSEYYVKQSLFIYFENNRQDISNEDAQSLVAKIYDSCGCNAGHSFEVSGVKVTFEAVYDIELPELTSEFLLSIGVQGATEHDFTKAVNEMLEFQAKKACSSYLIKQFYDFCDRTYSFDLPDKLFEGYDKDAPKAELELQIRRNMVLSALFIKGSLVIDQELVKQELTYKVKDMGENFNKHLLKILEDQAVSDVAQIQAVNYVLDFMSIEEKDVGYHEIQNYIDKQTD